MAKKTGGRGAELAASAWKVLARRPSLIAIPLVSAMLAVVLAGLAIGAWILAFAFWASFPPGTAIAGLLLTTLALVLAALFLAHTVVTFGAAATVAVAAEDLSGRPAPLRHGLAVAWSRRAVIFRWSALALTVGLVLSRMRQGRPQPGVEGPGFAGAAAGLAWSLATWLVVPVLVFEGARPLPAVRSSARRWRQVWGETYSGSMSAMAVLLLPGFFVVPLLLAGGYLLQKGSGVAGAVVLALGLLDLVAVFGVAVTLRSILRAALYRLSEAPSEAPIAPVR